MEHSDRMQLARETFASASERVSRFSRATFRRYRTSISKKRKKSKRMSSTFDFSPLPPSQSLLSLRRFIFHAADFAFNLFSPPLKLSSTRNISMQRRGWIRRMDVSRLKKKKKKWKRRPILILQDDCWTGCAVPPRRRGRREMRTRWFFEKEKRKKQMKLFEDGR